MKNDVHIDTILHSWSHWVS